VKTWSFYDPVTGELHGTVFSSTNERFLASNTPSGYLPIEGRLDAALHRVDPVTKQVVVRDEPLRPPRPSEEHSWDGHRWRAPPPTPEQKAQMSVRVQIAALEVSQARAVREHLLGDPKALERLAQIDNRIAELRKELSQ